MAKKTSQAGGTAGGGTGSTAVHTPDVRQVLENMELSSRILHENLAQQNAISHQQALDQLRIAAVGKCTELILSIDPSDPNAGDLLRQYKDLMDLFMDRLSPK